MAKNKRGKALKRDGYGRGTCPVCHRPRVKLGWEVKSGTTKIKVCKICNARILNGKETLS